MKAELIIEGKIYTVPTSWEDVTTGQFMSLHPVLQSTDLEDNEKIVLAIGILCNVPSETLNKCSLRQLYEVFSKMEFIKTEPKSEINKVYVINGKEFYFDTNFEATMNNCLFNDGRYLMKDNVISNLDKIAAMLIRPVIKKKYDYSKWKGLKKSNYITEYITEDYSTDLMNRNAALFRQQPITTVYTLALFFWTLSSAFVRNSMTYLQHNPK